MVPCKKRPHILSVLVSTLLQCDFEDSPTKRWILFLYPLNLGWSYNLLLSVYISKCRSRHLTLRTPSGERAWAVPVIQPLAQPTVSWSNVRQVCGPRTTSCRQTQELAKRTRRRTQMTPSSFLTHRILSQSVIVVLSHCLWGSLLNRKS